MRRCVLRAGRLVSLSPSLVVLIFAPLAQAHGPTPQKVDETITIKADPKAVWALAGDFAKVATWDSLLKTSEGSNKARKLTFQNGEVLEEEMDDYDVAQTRYSYRMMEPNVRALPASSYSATLVVTPGKDGGSAVEWFARVYRGDTGNEPPDELSDQAARDALSAFFKAGLEGLKAKAEGRS